MSRRLAGRGHQCHGVHAGWGRVPRCDVLIDGSLFLLDDATWTKFLAVMDSDRGQADAGEAARQRVDVRVSRLSARQPTEDDLSEFDGCEPTLEGSGRASSSVRDRRRPRRRQLQRAVIDTCVISPALPVILEPGKSPRTGHQTGSSPGQEPLATDQPRGCGSPEQNQRRTNDLVSIIATSAYHVRIPIRHNTSKCVTSVPSTPDGTATQDHRRPPRHRSDIPWRTSPCT
jgi:hypothetical protein